jgi:hypothetical protein
MNRPRYLVAVFGDPQPDKDAVDSGVYAPDPKYAPFSASPGDLVLLYCTAGYAAYPLQAPGLGVVLHADHQHIEYRWVPFAKPIPKADIDRGFDPDDAAKLRNIRFSSHWLFEVSRRVVSERCVDGSKRDFILLSHRLFGSPLECRRVHQGDVRLLPRE